MKNICKVAFIGAGYMTAEHIKSFSDIINVNIVGIYSRNKARAEKLIYELGVACNVYKSIPELYDQTTADLLIISVPEMSVREVCLEAFEYPWACLIEKPAGYNLFDAKQILNKATFLKRNAYVALNRRHYSSTKTLLENIEVNYEKRLIHIYDQEDLIAARKAGQPDIVLKNWMYANSIHMIDFLSILGRGKITSIYPIVSWSHEEPQFVVTKITYDSGDIGIYEAVWNCPGPWAVTVTTASRRWEMRPLENLMIQDNGSRILEKQHIHEWDTQFKPGLRLQANEAVKAALGYPHNLPSLLEATESMQIVFDIYESGI